MSTTKGGKHVFELREMKDAKPAKGSSVDVGAKIAAFKAELKAKWDASQAAESAAESDFGAFLA